MTRLLTLILLLAAAIPHTGAQTPAQEFAASAAVDSARSAVLIVDLATGRVVAEHNADASLIPASVMKAVTTAATIRRSGIDYRYRTDLYALGPIDSDGVLHGNLLVAGSGDPSLNAQAEPRSADFIAQCVDGLRARGVRRIEGIIEVDQSIFPGPACHPTWAAADTRASYGAGCYGLNFGGNRFGKSADPDPAATLTSRLRTAIANAGIEYTGEPSGSERRILIASHLSPTIDDIMRSCMMRSDNLYAEALLRTLAVLSGRKGTTEEGAALSAQQWKKDKLPMEGVVLADGSGLSRSNRLTARFLAGVLRKMAGNVDYVSFFPLAGADGTLRNFLKDTPLDSYIALKTGSMNGIQSYAGYKLDDNYAPTHVVVIICNAMPGSRAALRSACARMLLDIFAPEQNTQNDEQRSTDKPA